MAGLSDFSAINGRSFDSSSELTFKTSVFSFWAKLQVVPRRHCVRRMVHQRGFLQQIVQAILDPSATRLPVLGHLGSAIGRPTSGLRRRVFEVQKWPTSAHNRPRDNTAGEIFQQHHCIEKSSNSTVYTVACSVDAAVPSALTTKRAATQDSRNLLTILFPTCEKDFTEIPVTPCSSFPFALKLSKVT